MTKTPSDAAKREACRLAKMNALGVHPDYTIGMAEPDRSCALYAFALYIDEVSASFDAYLERWSNLTPSKDEFTTHFAKFRLPEPVDPLDEVIREAGKLALTPTAEWFRAEIEKRGGKIVFEDQADD